MSGEFSRLLQPKTRHGAAWLMAVLVLLVIAMGLASGALRLSNEIAQVKDEIARTGAQRQAQQVEPSKVEQEERKRWEVLAAERAFPWPMLFKAVETAIDPEVELLEFRPDKRQRTATLRGEAKTAEAIERYLDILASDKSLIQVYLVREAKVAHGHLVTIEFEIRLSLRASA